MRSTRALIYLNNLKQNIRNLKSQLRENIRICMAVKADGYGHGAAAVARAAEEEGICCFGVATVEEGIELRQNGIKSSILLYSLALPDEIPDIVRHAISPFTADRHYLNLISRESVHQRKKTGIHLKIDTGMGRIGCRPDDAVSLAETAASLPGVIIEGTCTHFPGADTADDDFTRNQIRIFRETVSGIRSRGINPGILHASNSAGILYFPEAHFDMVRPGIMLYGYPPVKGGKHPEGYIPVMSLESNVIFLKEVPENTPISYGMTYRTGSRTTIATIPAGYADGYNRLLSSRADVTIAEKRYRVSGRICMDQFMVDLGKESSVRLYDQVILFGPYASSPDAEELAALTGSISYEITCGVSSRVPRIYIDE